MAADISVTSAVTADLLKQLPAVRVLYGGADDRGIWNGAVKRVPALIVRPRPQLRCGPRCSRPEATIYRCRCGAVAMTRQGGRCETAGW